MPATLSKESVLDVHVRLRGELATRATTEASANGRTQQGEIAFALREYYKIKDENRILQRLSDDHGTLRKKR